MSNAIINDKKLTADGLGLLTYIFSKPDEWIPLRTDIRKRFKWGRDKIQKVLSELNKLGYFREFKLQGQGGTFAGSSLHFYERKSAPSNAKTVSRQNRQPEKALLKYSNN